MRRVAPCGSPAKAGAQGRREPASRAILPEKPSASGPRPSPGNKWLLALALAFAPLAPASADSLLPAARYADTQLPDPRQEAQARALMETLRCLVCQGQAISDSDAEMAGDMRALVRTRIQAGETPDQVRDWLIARYGNWVTYDPPFSWLTAPLWLLPILLVAAGVFLARGRFKRRRSN